MASLDSIPSASDRKSKAQEARPGPTAEEKQKQLEEHWTRSISTWASSSVNDRPLTIAHAGLISDKTIEAWKSSLEAKGYKVTVDSNRVTISE